MRQRSKSEAVGKFALDLIVFVGPIVLVAYLSIARVNVNDYQRWYFGLILGILCTLWGSLWWLHHKADNVSDAVKSANPLTIRLLTQDEIIPTVKWLYRTSNAKFYATHIGYRPIDESESDARIDDLARHIYANGAQIPFQRIIHVACKRDREWVAGMLSAKKNANYSVKIIEDLESKTPYPNYIVAEKVSGESLLLMSFRGATSDGAGYFAFLTNNEHMIQGIKDHFTKWFSELPTAEEAAVKWCQT